MVCCWLIQQYPPKITKGYERGNMYYYIIIHLKLVPRHHFFKLLSRSSDPSGWGGPAPVFLQRQGSLLCGATPQSEIGFKTVWNPVVFFWRFPRFHLRKPEQKSRCNTWIRG